MVSIKEKILLICLVLIIIVSNIWQYSIIKKYRKDNSRLQYNIENINFELDSVKDKNGEYHDIVSVLNLKTSELNKVNSELDSELKNMRIKVKNLENATKIVTEYKYVTDTIETIKYAENNWVSSFDNQYISANWKSHLDSLHNLTVTDFNATVNDTIITATEILYKGWWFWRKPKEIRLHIKSENPYNNINEVQSIKFTK